MLALPVVSFLRLKSFLCLGGRVRPVPGPARSCSVQWAREGGPGQGLTPEPNPVLAHTRYLTSPGLCFLFRKMRLMGVPAAAGMVVRKVPFVAFAASLGQVLALVELAVG